MRRPGACECGAPGPGARRARAAAPAARQANSSTSSAPIPTTSPPATSSGWCMPRYMRASATRTGITIATAQARRAALGSGSARSAAARARRRPRSPPRCGRTDSSRRPGGPRAVHVRAVARHRQRRDAVGRRLDHQREDGERGDPPLAQDGGDERDHADQDRQQRRPTNRRADLGRIGEERRALADDRADEAVVRASSSPMSSSTSVTSSPSAIEITASTANPASSAAKKTAAGCRPRSRSAKRSARPAHPGAQDRHDAIPRP